MKRMKMKISIITVISILLLSIESCSKDDNDSFKCTTYLNGDIWSEKTVSNCSLCFAPQGYTTSCN